MLTKEDCFEMITNWEEGSDESFFDYFSHDNITDTSWAFFLAGKGYSERTNGIINEIISGETCIDQCYLYELETNNNEGWSDQSHSKNLMLQAEFITATEHYTEKFTNWLKSN